MTHPPSDRGKHHATISADGKCSTPIETIEQLEVIELIIDGRAMCGGENSPTIIGSSDSFLPKSLHYSLSLFEPMDDGRCRVQYTQCNQ